MHGLAHDGDKPYAPTGKRPTVRTASVEAPEAAMPKEPSSITWDSQASQVFRSLELINSALDARTNPIYQSHGIHRADYPILDALTRHHPTHVLAPTQLAQQLVISTGALTPGSTDSKHRGCYSASPYLATAADSTSSSPPPDSGSAASDTGNRSLGAESPARPPRCWAKCSLPCATRGRGLPTWPASYISGRPTSTT